MAKRLLASAIFLCALTLYLLTLTQVHTFDALSYILDVDRKPWPELFHPHHLAYGPLGALIRSIAAASGWQSSAELLLQITNALAGAAGVALFAALIQRIVAQQRRGAQQSPSAGRNWPLAPLGALLLGGAYAYWYYAVEVEVYTIAAMFLIIALGLMLSLIERPSVGLAVALGVAQGLAVLFHQTNVLLCVPALVALIGSQRSEVRGRTLGAGAHTHKKSRAIIRLTPEPALLTAYLLPLGMIVGGAYLWVGVGVSGFRSWAALYGWAAGYTQTGWWGGAIDTTRWALLAQGLSATFSDQIGAPVGLGLGLTLLLNLRGLALIPRATLAVLVSWLLTYGAFFLWWEPDNIEFWIASLPPAILLLLLALRGPYQEQRIGYSLALLLGGAALASNFGAISARGDAGRDLQRRITAALAERSAPGDLLLVPDGLQELYLPFYAGRDQVFSLNQAMQQAGGDWPGACALIQQRIDLALRSGYGALIADAAIRPQPAPPGEPPSPAERFGLSAEEVARCYAGFVPALEPLAMPAGLPSYRHIPSAQMRADGPGWDFSRGGWGWRVANVAGASRAAAGWRLTPGVDPALISPPLQIEAAGYRAVEIRLAATTAARDAQLFFLDATGQADEERSIRWTLEPDAEMRTYRLALRDSPGWQGIIMGLRFDPVGAGDGGEVVIASIRLVR